MSFLPTGYESLKTEKNYWKMSQMKDGDNRLRIVCKPIAGWVDWKDKKPLRYRPEAKPVSPQDKEKPIKAFWSCYVWDYARESLFILEITQTSILKSLTQFATDEDWGDFTKYDIKINKEGSNKDTRYSVTPLPHKPLSSKIEEAMKKSPVNLDALYYGGDPWSDLGSPDETLATSLNQLRGYLFDEGEGIEIDSLEDFINQMCHEKGESFDKIVESALLPQLLPRFKAAYVKFLNAKETLV